MGWQMSRMAWRWIFLTRFSSLASARSARYRCCIPAACMHVCILRLVHASIYGQAGRLTGKVGVCVGGYVGKNRHTHACT